MNRNMSETEYAPILISVYDRLDHLKRAIDALRANEPAAHSILYIVSDAAYKEEHKPRIQAVRDYLSSMTGFKEVRLLLRQKNLGAHESIKSAIEEVLASHESFIFLEDDIVVAPGFLRFMNEGLRYYRAEKRIFAISGFHLPFSLPAGYDKEVYFFPCNSPWGFATWRDRWQKVNIDYYDRYGELKKDPRKYKAFAAIGFFIKGILQADSARRITAMDLRIYYHMFRHQMYAVFPVVSKTQNWGFDGSGEHCDKQRAWWAKPVMDTTEKNFQFIPFEGCNEAILKNHRKLQDKINGGILAKYLKYTWLHRKYTLVKNKWTRR